MKNISNNNPLDHAIRILMTDDDSSHSINDSNDNDDVHLKLEDKKTALDDSSSTRSTYVETDVEQSSTSSDDDHTCHNSGDDDRCDNNDDETEPKSVFQEIQLLTNLAIPSMVAQLSWSVPSALVASYIGRTLGVEYLNGYFLVMSLCNLCTLSLFEGVFSAMDTLMPQAFGYENFSELELVAIRGVVVCFIILGPFTIILGLWMDPILQYFGQDATASELAQDWFRIYAMSYPFYALFHSTNIFLAAQNVLMPEMYSVLVSVLLVLPVSLYVLGEHLGFIGTALAIVFYQAFQLLFLWCYVGYTKCYHPETWKGLRQATIVQSLRWKPFASFLWLGAGGMLANSEWIYWEIVSLIIGTLGVTDLSVQTIPTQVLTGANMIYLGFGIALSLRIGNVLPQSAYAAKRLCYYGCIYSLAIFMVIAYLTYAFRNVLIRLFTKEQTVIDGCEEIWVKVTIYSFNVGLYAMNGGIATGLGQQWMFGLWTVVFLFGIGIPVLYFFTIIQDGGGINTAWQCIVPPNIAFNITMLIVFARSDWNSIADAVRDREEAEEAETLALVKKDTR